MGQAGGGAAPSPQLGPCWDWPFKKTQKGYGQIRVNGKVVYAHRAQYEYHVGPIPEGMVIRHRCDNPSCVRPSHLELGTHKDNSMDAQERGRTARGSRHGGSRLTEAQVELIRTSPLQAKDLARMLGVSDAAVCVARQGKSWGHVAIEGLTNNRKRFAARGEAQPMAKLTSEQAADIYLSTEPSKDLARKYGVSKVTVNGIKAGTKWQHVTAPLRKRNP